MASRYSTYTANSSSFEQKKLYLPVDMIGEDLKKKGGSNNKIGVFSDVQKKLGLKGKKEGEKERKALMEVKNVNNANTRTLANVLRNERELLNANREQEQEIIQLRLLLEKKNIEVENLKDLCLNQREEIQQLKNSLLFPDVNVLDSHIKKLMEKQSLELSQARQLIPSLQSQVTSLTGQLQCLAVDIAGVKAEKIYNVKGSYEANARSSMFQGYYTEEATSSLELSATPGSPDDLFLKDLNPCLTPEIAKTMSKEFMGYDTVEDEWLPSSYNMQMGEEVDFCSCDREVSNSSDYCHCANKMNGSYRVDCRLKENKCTGRKQIYHTQF